MSNTSKIKASPTFILDLIDNISKKLWANYNSYKTVHGYIKRWHEVDLPVFGNYVAENFSIEFKLGSDNIDLEKTLNGMQDELLFQIAVDLGIEVPGLIYGVPEIKGLLAERYEDVGNIFQNAFEKIYSEPHAAIMMANSALERIVKKICNDNKIKSCNSNDTLYKLVQHILKEFNLFPDKKLNSNIRNIGSGFLSIAQAIEGIRSNNTFAHGTEDEIISDPIYAMLAVNSVSTIGLFLLNYYEKQYVIASKVELDDNIPF